MSFEDEENAPGAGAGQPARGPAAQTAGGFTLYEYVKRVRTFRSAVLALPAHERGVFERRWPDIFRDTDPLMWNDDKTALAERYWREATGQPVPDGLRPPRFADVRALRSRNEALALAQEVQSREGGVRKRTTLEAGKDNRGGQKRHYNDLNNLIFHDARDFLALPTDAVLFLAGHEIGHTRYYPGTRARAEFDRALMEMHDAKGSGKWFGQKGATWGGKSTSSLFQNWLGDQIINYRQQFSGHFGERFHKGLFYLLTHDPGQQERRGSSWFFKMHFRLLWASAIKYAGGYHQGERFVKVRDVGDIPPIITVDGKAYPQVTYHDGPEWLRVPNGEFRLVALWKAIHGTPPANVRKNLKRIMDLSEPFFFPPKESPPPTVANPDGVLCPRCKKADRVRITPSQVPDPDDPSKVLPRLACDGCRVHEDSTLRGMYEYDKDTNRTTKMREV